MESYITGKKARGEWYLKEDLHSDGPTLTSSQVWLRSIARITLVGILATLPWMITGAFISILCGAIIGLSTDMLVRGIMNWMPPTEEETQIKKQ